MHASEEPFTELSPYQIALQRIRAEFTEMPGMQLTAPQVQRLSGLNPDICRGVLDDLVRAKFLRVGANATYIRAAHEGLTRSRSPFPERRVAG